MKGKVFFAVIFVVLFFVAGRVDAEENLLLNPSFEEGEHIDYWINDGAATYNWVADWNSQEGSWGFGVGNDSDWAKDNVWAGCFQVVCDPDDSDNLYPVSPEENFTFKMWFKGEENYSGKAGLKLEFFDYDRRLGLTGDPIASFESKTYTGSFDWCQETVSGVAPEDTVSIVVSGVSEDMPIGPQGGSFIWFDNASLTATSAQ
ncbi:MAG: hypothetical protein KAS46_06375 [Candidatus Aureabacteria bacterium]|nr:hypothetical protein [Candidatus Auribacterota bacterium]